MKIATDIHNLELEIVCCTQSYSHFTLWVGILCLKIGTSRSWLTSSVNSWESEKYIFDFHCKGLQHMWAKDLSICEQRTSAHVSRSRHVWADIIHCRPPISLHMQKSFSQQSVCQSGTQFCHNWASLCCNTQLHWLLACQPWFLTSPVTTKSLDVEYLVSCSVSSITSVIGEPRHFSSFKLSDLPLCFHFF